MSPQILITGATGFIGRHLTRDLMGPGGRVRLMARQPRKARELFGSAVEIVPGELGDRAALARACRGVETIYHIAGCYRFGLRHRGELWRTNVEGSEALFRAAAEAGARRVVHLSSAGVLAARGARPATETCLDEDDFPAQGPRYSAYKASKWEAERRALSWARRGLPVVIASTTCPIGSGDDAPTPTGRMILDFMQGRFPFYCRTGLNFVAAADLSRGLQLVAEAGRPGERYLLSGENLWLKQFLDLLALETGRTAPVICLPIPFVKAMGCAGEAFDFLAGSRRNARVCLETALQADRVQFFSHAKARAELGWRPRIPLRASVREALAWYGREPELGTARPAASPLESHVR